MIGTLPAECLALATGLFPKRPPSPTQLSQAANLHARAAAAIKSFLKAEGPEPIEWTRPPEQEQLHADLLAELPLMDWAGTADHIPLHILPQWGLVLGQARKYAADKWPIFDAEGLTPANYALSSDELGDEWEIIRALDGIKNFFADLSAHCLSPAQVTAVKTAYPDWYESLDRIVFEALVDMLSAKRALTWQQEDQVRVLRGLPDEAPITATQKSNPPPSPDKDQPTSKSVRQLRTKDERIESSAQEAK